MDSWKCIDLPEGHVVPRPDALRQLERYKESDSITWLGHASVFLTSIWGGAIAIGTGLIAVYPTMYFYGLTLLQVKGTSRIPSLVKVPVVLYVFDSFGLVDWQLGAVFAVGMFIGGYAGAHFAIKLGDSRLRWILLVFVALFSAKLLLGL